MKIKSINLKTITLLTMLTLLIFCLMGCASVEFATYHNADGSISEYVNITLDETLLHNHGYSIQSVEFEIKTKSHIEANSLLTEYRNKLANEYQENRITNIEYQKLYNGVTLIEIDWNNGQYLIGLNFVDSSTYREYYKLLNNITFSTSSNTVEKLFYTKTYYHGTTNYGDYSIFKRIYNYYSNTIFSQFSTQQTSLTYSYSVSTRRMHSDADSVRIDSQGNYIHSWIVDPVEPAKPIYFYTISANRPVWLITCISTGLLVSVTLCIVGIFKYLKIKNKEKILDK